MKRSPVIAPMMNVSEVTALTILYAACPDQRVKARALKLVPELAEMVGEDNPRTYTISDDRKSITCLRCDLTSHNLNDVENCYCGNCRIFHEIREDDPL